MLSASIPSFPSYNCSREIAHDDLHATVSFAFETANALAEYRLLYGVEQVMAHLFMPRWFTVSTTIGPARELTDGCKDAS